MRCTPVDLTTAEQELLECDVAEISDFFAGRDFNDRPHNERTALLDQMGILVESLVGRGAISKVRLLQITDDRYGIKQNLSIWGMYKRNRRKKREMIRDPNFAKHVRFLVLGPDLPSGLCSEFLAHVDECGPLTGGDDWAIKQCARSLVRRHQIQTERTDEFFRLALEHERIEPELARGVRTHARRAAGEIKRFA